MNVINASSSFTASYRTRNVRALARQLCRSIAAELALAQRIQLALLSANVSVNETCPSLRFLDTSMLVAEAFAIVFKRDPDPDSEAERDVMDAAWMTARLACWQESAVNV